MNGKIWALPCRCDSARDWLPTDNPSITFHTLLGVYCSELNSVVVLTDHSVFLHSHFNHSNLWQLPEHISHSPCSSNVSCHHWAQGKHDISLIKKIEPVVITLKSDFILCKCEYPLKPEAIKGIWPALISLKQLDPIAESLLLCLRAVAASNKAMVSLRDIVDNSSLTLLIPHAALAFLLEQKMSHLSAAQWLQSNAVLLETSNITVKCCNVHTPAPLLPTKGDGKPHGCIITVAEVCSL